MLLVLLRLHAFQELRIDILEAMRANPATPICALSSS
jgi:hypothetical protein